MKNFTNFTPFETSLNNLKTKLNLQQIPWFQCIDRKIKISPQQLYIHLKNKNDIITVENESSHQNSLYRYENGFYKKWSLNQAYAYIKNFLPPEYRQRKHWEAVYNEFVTDFSSLQEEQFNSDENIINFKNGILDLKQNELIEHSPRYYSTIQIPFNYNPNLTLDDAPVFSQYIQTLTNSDSELIDIIIEFIGAVISNVYGYRYKKFLVLEGIGNTGKTQLLELITKLIGEENYHSIDMGGLNKRFGSSQLYSKRLVGSGDMKFSKVSEIDKIKELTGGDSINAEFKNKDAFTFKYRGLLMFVTNELPIFNGDFGDHVYERFMIIPCNNIIPEDKRDKLLLEKMKSEAEAIISIAVKCLMKTIENGYKFTEGTVICESRKQYKLRTNSLCKYIETK